MNGDISFESLEDKPGCLEIKSEDLDKICRTCLSNQEVQPITQLRYNDTNLAELLYICASVQVLPDLYKSNR